MPNISLDTDGDIVYRRRGDARTLEEHVDNWAARRMLAGVPARRCVLPFLTGAPKAVECRVCSRVIYAGEEIKCSDSHCRETFHLNCVVKDTSNFIVESFRCPQHRCMVCKQKEFFWRCVRCTVAAHSECAPWPVIDLDDDDDYAICWRHPSDWLLQNKIPGRLIAVSTIPVDGDIVSRLARHGLLPFTRDLPGSPPDSVSISLGDGFPPKADSTNNIEEVFCQLPLPYVNKNFNTNSTIRDFAAAVCKPPPYMAIRRNVYLIKKKRTGVDVDTGCTNCRAYSTCKEDCECRALSMSCSKNCRCSDLCTNKPFHKDEKIEVVKLFLSAMAWYHRIGTIWSMEKSIYFIDDATREQRLWDIKKRGDKNCYMYEVSKDFTIDATFKGNISCFLNHSCEPNCKLEKWQVDGETRVGFFASCAIKVGEPLTYDYRWHDRNLPSFHSLDLICEAIARRGSQDASVGARAQHVASIGEEQNNMNSPQRMVDFGKQGLDHELEQNLLDESLEASANDADQQAQRSDERVTKRPLTIPNRGISKKHKLVAEMPCIEETRSVHRVSRSAQANLNEQEANRGKDYPIARCLHVLDAMEDVPDGIKTLASDVFRDSTNREMFLCYAPRLRGLWLKKEVDRLHSSRLVN